jgi:predicted ATPase/DNA-binding CsgD family transcriptional regulator
VSKLAGVPEPLTSLIGREREIRQIADLLNRTSTHHVTLCGAGGIGKTRLALRVAQGVAPDFGDAVAFLDLSPLTDPSLVPSGVANVLGVVATNPNRVEQAIVEHLEDRSFLIVLDNFEHLMSASPLIPHLTAACPNLVVLVTSRERLWTSGEWVIDVDPLSLPDAGPTATLDATAASAAVQLFVERAQAATADFVLDEGNARDVATICRRLDGLPLAIELVAARIAHLPVGSIAAKFQRLLPLLEGGRRDLPARLRTMRDAIDWSYRLLSSEEQDLFRCLAVFAGGCTIDAADAILSREREGANRRFVDPVAALSHYPETLRLLTSLVDKHLVRTQAGSSDEPRYDMAETIREFAAEQWDTPDQEIEVKWAHVQYFLALAQRSRPELRGPEPGAWLLRLDAELDNFRSALDWLLRTGEPGDITALTLCNNLAHFWLWRGHSTEAKLWLQRAVKQSEDSDSLQAAGAYLQLGHLEHGNASKSFANYQRSLALFREAGYQRGIAGVLSSLGMIAEQLGRYDDAKDYLTESLSLSEQLQDPSGIAQASYNLGILAGRQGEIARGKRFLETARGLWEQLGNVAYVAFAIAEVGRLYRLEGRTDEATDLLVWSLTRLSQAGINHGLGQVHYELGEVALIGGHLALAAREFQESLRISRAFKTVDPYFAGSIEGCAQIALRRGQPQVAVQLCAAVDAWRTSMSFPLAPAEEKARQRALREARKQLGDREFDVAWNRGRLATLLDAADVASSIEVGAETLPDAVRRHESPGVEHLTGQERRVLCLIADGLSNQQIADRLQVQVRTVTTHVTRILGKLEAENRTHASALAFRHGLCPSSSA